MNKNVIFLLCVILSLVISIIPYSIKKNWNIRSKEDISVKKGCVIINEKKCSNVEVNFYDEYAHIPFVEVLNELGLRSFNKNKNELFFTHEEKTYVLNLHKKTLIEKDKNFNFLTMPPGNCYYFCEMINNRLMIDTQTFQSVMSLCGINISMEVDSQNYVVRITQGDGSPVSFSKKIK